MLVRVRIDFAEIASLHYRSHFPNMQQNLFPNFRKYVNVMTSSVAMTIWSLTNYVCMVKYDLI
jgi:hypothetical protein